MFIASEAWKEAYPGAEVGILAMDHVANPEHHHALDREKQQLENELRSRFGNLDRAALKGLGVIQAYNSYYKRFKKTYHVLLQLESVVRKGKSIPRVAALVEAMFMAELKNMLLTAGHDLEVLKPPVRIDVADGSENYTRIDGQEQTPQPMDMFIADTQGILSTVLYGPDRRTRITPRTDRVFFTVYAPPGIGKQPVDEHLRDIQTYVSLIAPKAEVELMEVYGTD
ncbi:MAG: phenylalanine--tRNA ligase beta subunit-related protein [Syntrophobacteria bacterium]